MPRRKISFHSKRYREFTGKLRSARAESKFSQRDVAKRLQKPPSYVAKIESGERRVDFIELQDLARLYRKPISFFEE
jgi:transcriptional regulator with XRE-family HTH domain